MNTKRRKQAKTLRRFRAVHRTTGITLLLFFVCMSVTGLLLGWKKNSNGYILASTAKGTSNDLSTWLSLDSLCEIAHVEMSQQLPHDAHSIDRVDVRASKGIVKFTFKDHYHGLQLDGATGKVLKHEYRRSDLIENIHDGSIVDDWLKLPSGLFKLIYTSIMGLSLLVFCITGFWLWYGPKRMRRG